MFEVVLFDNDGVLVDTETLYFQATREALAQAGVTLTAADYVELFLRQGRGAWHLAEAQGTDAATIDRLRAWRDRRYGALIDAGMSPCPARWRRFAPSRQDVVSRS